MVAVRGVLTRLRKRSGLSPDRLHNTEIDTTPLLQLAVVRRYAHLRALTPQAAVPIVVGQVARRLPPTQRLIVDAELSLGLLRDAPPAALDLGRLYGPDLGERRAYLATHWQTLHEALGADQVPVAPKVRTLRDTPEAQAFTALARLLTSGSELDLTRPPEPGEPARCPTVTVVGDAVVDQISVVETFPEPGTSHWGDFVRHPGGKGLNRAVALARLGIDARLVATIGDDADGRWIVDYLRAQRVDTSLVTATVSARTPVTTVILTLAGESAAIAFKQDRLRLTDTDIDSAVVRAAIAASDAVLVTFEQPIDIVARVLAMVHDMTPRPWLIVSASPPTVLPRHLYPHLAAVDYFIGTAKELLATWPGSTAEESTNRLLQWGVHAVCLIDSHACTIRSRTAHTRVRHVNVTADFAAGASSAFSSALAYRLTTTRRPADDADFEWVTAAISARTPASNIPESMPSIPGIDALAPHTTADRDHRSIAQ
ncbi:carbohydrate kinase family protein [Nocardia sp. NPDC055321]